MKVLFVSPYAGMWPHAVIESICALNLQEGASTEIEFLRCNTLFQSRCTTMSAFGLSYQASLEERKEACAKCISNRDLITKNFKFGTSTFDEHITHSEIAEIQKLVSTLTLSNFINFEYKGFPIAQWAIYEFLLDFKKNNLQLNDTELEIVKNLIATACMAVDVAQKYLSKNRPDAVAAYNGLYLAHRCFLEVAKKEGIRAVNLHGGTNLAYDQTSIFICDSYNLKYIRDTIACWDQVKSKPISSAAVKKVFDHCRVLLEGKSLFVYSQASEQSKNLHRILNITEDKKIVTASLSSYDERFAAEAVGILEKPKDSLFKDQVEWVSHLLDWAKTRSDVMLIIRPHPRELPNKRESVTSPHAIELKKLLSHLPQNVRVNWPEDNISIYDLALVTDVFLSAWSSVSLESALFGTPNVLYSRDLPLYPADISSVGENVTHYFECIDIALKTPFSIDRIKAVYRWFHLYQSVRSVNISPQSQLKARQQYSFIQKVAGKIDAVIGTKILKIRDIWYAKNKKIAHSQQAEIINAFLPGQTSVLTLTDKYPVISEAEEILALKTATQEMLTLLGAKDPYRSQLKRIQLLTEFCNSVTVKS